MMKIPTYNRSLGGGQKFTTLQDLNNRLNRNKVIDYKITSFYASFLWSFLIWFGDYYEY